MPLRACRRHRRPRVGRAIPGQCGRRGRVDGYDLGRPQVLPEVRVQPDIEIVLLNFVD